jgi:hypothetical protein
MTEAELRDRIAELEEENRQLREALMPSNNPFKGKLGLPLQLAVILSLLYHRSVASYAALEQVMNDNSHLAKDSDLGGFQNRVKVAVCKLRAILDQHDIEIRTIRAVGYSLDPANKAKLNKLIGDQR